MEADAYSTVLGIPISPNVGTFKFCKTIFEKEEISIGPVYAKAEGTVNTILETLSPSITFDVDPETVHAALMVGVKLLRILKN